MATARPARDNVNWLYINTACFGVCDTIAKTSASITRFVREVRESRSDFDIISSELHSLDRIVDLLKDDVSFFPPELAQKTPAVLDTCFAILNELDGCISVLDRSNLSRQDKKSRWVASRDHIGKLGGTLEGYKSTLGLVVDLISLNRPSTTAGVEESDVRDSEEDRKQEAAKLATEIQELAARLEPQARQNGAVARLRQYLDALHNQASTKSNGGMKDVPERHHASASPSVSDAPDSAIELCDDQPSSLRFKQESTPNVPRSPTTDTSSICVDEVDEILDKLRDMRRDAPAPPPRSARRALRGTPSFDRSSNTGSYTTSVSSGYRSSSGQSQHSSLNSWQRSVNHGHSWSQSPSETPDSIYEGYSTPATEISGTQSDRDSGSLEKVRPDSETIGQPLDFSRFSRFENPRSNVPVPPSSASFRPSTSSSSATNQSGRMSSGMTRRSSSRLSTALRGLRIGGRRSSSYAPTENRVPMPIPPVPPSLRLDSALHFQLPESLPVFGVSLAQSMQVAKGIGHDGYSGPKDGGSKNSTSREYPLCVLRCVYFLQDQGLKTPDLFGQDGDHIRLSELKEIFSSIDTGYGKFLDWRCFTVHEAADLILLFLSELPTPLVPESVAKRWVFLSRQATVAGSMAMRLDQGIDFWEEAFLGIHGASRALLRLLLNLWGDIADLSEFNDMTAERLAGRAMRPLMHLPAARFETDLMLGLAFMIRKRSEYRMKAKGTGRRSNAACN
ncbi:putative GTPase-activating protein [Naviculisporaceae sp. PSN 640]